MMKVREGQLEKLGLLFERYNRRLYGFFYRLTGRMDVSEDLVQEVFERIIKYRHTYTGEGSFSTWIFQIARNLQADHYHRQSRRNQVEQAFEDESPNLEKPEPTVLTMENRQQQLLEEALNRLSPEKKETLILSRYHGFKYSEIAEITDSSVSAVKVRIFRGIRELKEIVSELNKKEEI